MAAVAEAEKATRVVAKVEVARVIEAAAEEVEAACVLR